MMRFLDKPLPPPDEDDVFMYYRLYWIEEYEYPISAKLYHDVDNKKQFKVMRENYSMKSSGEEEFHDMEIGDSSQVVAKILVHRR